jgi:hypothetical protein
MAGEAGASLRELMDRMGHSSMRAALIYRHRTAQRDKLIADATSQRVDAELATATLPIGHVTGTESWTMLDTMLDDCSGNRLTERLSHLTAVIR